MFYKEVFNLIKYFKINNNLDIRLGELVEGNYIIGFFVLIFDKMSKN